MPARKLHVHFLPDLLSPEELRGATVVVIDVLRASTTIITALAEGAEAVIPCLNIEDVRAAAEGYDRQQIVLGGERGGEKIDLFDLGNSPSEYSPEAIEGKTVLFTTTNGTKALERCREAHQVFIGAPVNLAAVCDRVSDTLNVHLLCAGTDGAVTREDILFAGAVVYQLTKKDEFAIDTDDAAQVARAAWRSVVAGAIGAGEPTSTRLAREFRKCRGGQNLLAIGHEADLTLAAQLDAYDCVPELNLGQWSIALPERRLA